MCLHKLKYIIHCPEYFSPYFAPTYSDWPWFICVVAIRSTKPLDKLDVPTDMKLSSSSTLKLTEHTEKFQQLSCRVNAYAYS